MHGPAADGASRRSAKRTRAWKRTNRAPSTILIADDDRGTVDAMAQLLGMSGYAVVGAYSVREALDLLDEHSEIDLVVSDIRMPDLDGFDLLRVLRHRFPTLPVILLTGLPITNDDVVPHQAVILQKPVTGEALERAIVAKLAQKV